MPVSANITDTAAVAFTVPVLQYGFTMTNNSGATVLFRLGGTVSRSGETLGLPIFDGITKAFVFRDPLPYAMQIQAIRESGSDAVTVEYETVTRSVSCADQIANSGPASPPIPQNVQATAGNKKTTLTWDADANLGYAVYFSRTNNFATAQLFSAVIPAAAVSYDVTASVNANPATASNHAVGTFYYYWVCGTDGAGNVVTEPSTVVSARPYITVTASTSENLYVPDAATMTIGTVLFAVATPPIGFQIIANSTVYVWNGTFWLNTNTFGNGNSDSISGAFSVNNGSASSFTFWNTSL